MKIVQETTILFNGVQVRMFIDEHGEPWWLGREICEVLGLKNPHHALARLKENERNTLALSEGNRGNPNQIIINEAGLYRLIFSSEKPEAESFKEFITHEVLPKIRKEGGYGKMHEFGKVAVQILQEMQAKESEIEFHKRQQKILQEELNKIKKQLEGKVSEVRQLEIPFEQNKLNYNDLLTADTQEV